jgi:hypothetical protein
MTQSNYNKLHTGEHAVGNAPCFATTYASARIWYAACLGFFRHETELPHFGTDQGMLRHLWRLAESSAHAGRSPWLVLRRLLPGLQSAAGCSGDTSADTGGTRSGRGATGSLKPAAIWAIGA